MSRLLSLNFGVKHQFSRLRIMRGMKFIRQNRLKAIPLLPLLPAPVQWDEQPSVKEAENV